jgi:hypothetical protein
VGNQTNKQYLNNAETVRYRAVVLVWQLTPDDGKPVTIKQGNTMIDIKASINYVAATGISIDIKATRDDGDIATLRITSRQGSAYGWTYRFTTYDGERYRYTSSEFLHDQNNTQSFDPENIFHIGEMADKVNKRRGKKSEHNYKNTIWVPAA